MKQSEWSREKEPHGSDAEEKGLHQGHATNYFWAHKEPLEGILLSPLGKRIDGNGLPGLPHVKEKEKKTPLQVPAHGI